MLNLIRYRTSWLIAAVALIILPLTLRSAPSLGRVDNPPSVDIKPAQNAQDALQLLAAGGRAPGSEGDRAAANYLRQEFGRQATSQRFSARTPRGEVQLENVYVVERGSGVGQSRAPILVVAPRDAAVGVLGGYSGSALLIALDRLARTTTHNRPIFFVSTDGSTLGNAGIRWFLAQNRNVPFAGAVVLDAPAEAAGNGISLWMGGSGSSAAPGFRQIAAAEARAAGMRVAPEDPFWAQLLRLAVPQTIGDQGAIVTESIPAVTLSARPESPLQADRIQLTDQAFTPERLGLVAAAAQNIISTIDASTRLPRPGASILVTGRIMRPSVLRLALLIALVPILVVAGDLAIRLRRGRIFLGRGLRALRWRFLAPAVALLAGNILTIVGLLPEGAAGRPPLADTAGFTGTSVLALLIVAGAALAAWRFARPRVEAAHALPPTDSGAALIVLAITLVATWIVHPFALVLALPAAHAAILATVDRDRWKTVLLAGLAILPVLLLVGVIGGLVDRSTIPALWYLAVTTVAGTRGILGPGLGLAIGVCIWTLIVPALARRYPPPTRRNVTTSATRPNRSRSRRPGRPRGSADPTQSTPVHLRR